MTARPIPDFLRAPSADDIVERVRAALPALNVARKNVRQALTGGPVSLDERARVADLLDDAVAEMYAAVSAPAPQAAPPQRQASGTSATGHYCVSGRHYWISADDAERCCNGHRRELQWSGTRYWHVWVPIADGDAA